MCNTIIFNFDGTGNEPLNSSYDAEKKGESISNILKLHLLFGGGLHQDHRYGRSSRENIKASFYYQGIGTYSNTINNAFEAIFAFSQGDKKDILNKAMDDFASVYTAGNKIIITGFSRGAAIARKFVTLIEEYAGYSVQPCVFLCLFDTVISDGVPDLSDDSRPSCETLYHQNFYLSPIVNKALHMVSIDEHRLAFQPSLLNHDPERVEEIWFSGVHSDIGGGFLNDGLSDLTMLNAIEWLLFLMKLQMLPTFPLDSESLSLDESLPMVYRDIIDDSDLTIKPNKLSHIHYKKRKGLFCLLTLESRKVCVLKDDHIVTDGSIFPVIHPSVYMRMSEDPDYNPEGLQGVHFTLFSGY